MRILSIVHQADAGSGLFGAVAERLGHELVEWVPPAGPPPEDSFGAAMVFGGGMHPDQELEHPWLASEKTVVGALLEQGTPMLCTCLGAELLAGVAGAVPERLPAPEIGWRSIALTPEAAADPVLGGLPDRFCGFQWHSFGNPLPDGGVRLAPAGVDGVVNAFRVGDAWGLQFHAEVTRDIVTGWIERYNQDEDAVMIGLDPEPLLAETEERIADWNAIGERIATGFVEYAASRESRN